MSLIDISNESFKLFHISENDFLYNSINDNINSNKSSKINSIYKNKNFFISERKSQTLNQLEKIVHNHFIHLYYHDKSFYNIKVISDIINNSDTHLVAEFKDYLIMGDDSEFLQRKYSMKECQKYLPILFDYYKSCSIIFPNYVLLHENKYIFKNIRKKQKVIDNQQEQEEKKEKIKKGEIILDENEEFFTTKTLNSILNQTNTSNMKIFFGINKSKNINNEDSEENVNNLFKNIVKAEHQALLLNKKSSIIKKNFQKLSKNEKNEESNKKNNISNNNNSLNINKGKGKKISNYSKNTKKKNNIIDNNKNDSNINNNIDKNSIIDSKGNIEKHNNINVLYTNRNKILNPKNFIKKLNTKARHIKSNTCIFETDVNKKSSFIDMNNSTNKRILKINISKKKILQIKETKKKEKLTNKEVISKIMAKIKNANSAIFQGNNSFNNIHKKRLINMKKFHNPTSISPPIKIKSYVKNKNNCDSITKINESNSTPNINQLQAKKKTKNNSNIKNNQILKEVKDKSKDVNLLKVKSIANISTLNKIIQRNDSYNIYNNSKIFHKNNNNNKYLKNKNKTKNYLTNSIKYKIKKNNKNETKKFNLNIYKISSNSNAYKYYTNHNTKYGYLQSSNKAMTISDIKTIGESKFESIKVMKRQRTINSKKIKKSDINNNININININSNNIYNNTNQINNSNNNSIQNSSININNNNALTKKKYYEILRESTSFISKRNERQPILKKMILTSNSNSNIYIDSSKKNFILDEMNKKKNSVFNNNTLTFSGCLTCRNSRNSSKIKNKMKKNSNYVGNIKSNISNHKVKIKKEFLNKKEVIIFPKYKIPMKKSPKPINKSKVNKK